MCGYVSNNLRKGVMAASRARSERKSAEAGNVYGVARLLKSGKVGKADFHKFLPLCRAESTRASMEKMNPGSSYVVVDCRDGKAID